MYEYHIPLFMSADLDLKSSQDPYHGNQQYTAAPVASADQKERFVNAIKYLTECMQHLQYEQKGTFENAIYNGAIQAYHHIKGHLQQIWMV